MKPNNEMCTRWFPREFYCALGPTEILATLRDEEQHGVDHPFIWESYKLDEAHPVIGEWPYPEDTDEEILEKLNDDECNCRTRIAGITLSSAPEFRNAAFGRRTQRRSSGIINFADPIRFFDNEGRALPRDHICAATIKCTDCEFEAVMRLVLTKRWYDGYEDKALLIGGS